MTVLLRLCAQADPMSGLRIWRRSFSAARIVRFGVAAPEDASATFRAREQRGAERMHAAILTGSALHPHAFTHGFFSAIHSGSALYHHPFIHRFRMLSV